MKRFLTLALLAVVLTVPAAAQEVVLDREDSLAAAAHRLLAEDAGERASARERLSAEPGAALAVVLQLVEQVRAERAGAAAVRQGERVARADPTDVQPYVQLYDVHDLVEQAGGPGSLLEVLSDNGHGAMIRFADEKNGVLIVMGVGSVHDALQGTLDDLRGAAQPMVLLETRFLEADRMQDLGIDLTDVRPGAVVMSDGVVERVREWAAAARVDVLSAPSLVTTLGQPANITLGREVSYVSDIDIEVGSIADPVIDTVFAGTTLDLEVWGSAEGGYRVHVDHHTADLREPMDVIEFDIGAAEPARIQAPDVYETRVKRSLEMADGQAVLLALPGPPDSVRLMVLSVLGVDLAEDEADGETPPK